MQSLPAPEFSNPEWHIAACSSDPAPRRNIFLQGTPAPGGGRFHVSGAGGSAQQLRYAITTDGEAIQFQLRNTADDRGPKDRQETRRAELAVSGLKLKPSVEYWDAFTVTPIPYPKPGSLAATTGGLFAQIKLPGEGSPILGMRRTPDDRLQITTKGAKQAGLGETRYLATWELGRPHYFVRKMRFSGSNGELSIWLDGEQIVNLKGIPMGGDAPALPAYAKIGAYYSGGIGPDPCSSVTNIFASYIPPRLEPIAP